MTITPTRRLAYAALLGNVIIWGAALPIVKPALYTLTPYQFLYLRYLLAATIMLPVTIAIFPKNLPKKTLITIIGLEFIQVTLSLSVLYQALALTSALTASLIGSTAPIFVTLAGIFFLKEKEEKHEWLGLSLSALGTLAIILASATYTSAKSGLPGVLLMLLYQGFNVTYLLLAKKYYPQLNKMFIAGISCLVGFLSYGLITPLTNPINPLPIALHHLPSLLAVIYMGLLGSPLAVALLLYGQSKIEASEASLFTYLQPLIYIPLSILWLKDRLLPTQILGLILVVAGVVIAELRPRSRRHRHR